MQKPSLTFLHLSDLHFGHGGQRTRFDQEIVAAEIIKDVERQVIKLGSPDWVLLTGDVAFSADETDEYSKASKWLQKLIAAAHIAPQQVLAVPGNHDVRRLAVKDLKDAENAHKDLRDNPQKIDEYLGNPLDLVPIWRKLVPWSGFARQFGAPDLSSESPFWTKEVLNAPLGAVWFAGLNTCILSQDKLDSNINLILGKTQLQKAVHCCRNDSLLVVLQHHSPEFLIDGGELRSHLASRPHLLFCGHLHTASGVVGASTDGGRVEFVAGAGHEDVGLAGEHGYAWVRLGELGLDYYPRRWEPRQVRFIHDANGFPAMQDEHVHYSVDQLPEGLRTWLARSLANAIPVNSAQDIVGAANSSNPGDAFDPSHRYVSIPFEPKRDRMIGRAAGLARVHAQLSNGRPTAIGHTAAFSGIGGVGKTQLAVEYAWEYQENYPGGVYWFTADQDLGPQILRLSDRARWAHPNTEPALKLEMALQRLQTVADCLFIFDNVEEIASIRKLLPEPSRHCHVLLTSRWEHPGFEPVPVSLLEPAVAYELLVSEAGRTPEGPPEISAAHNICLLLGGLPLAIEMVGAFLHLRHSRSFAEYATTLADKGLPQPTRRNRYSLTGAPPHMRQASPAR
jgi:3',5'-cyclic AMP phosphodiesterase CpdA